MLEKGTIHEADILLKSVFNETMNYLCLTLLDEENFKDKIDPYIELFVFSVYQQTVKLWTIFIKIFLVFFAW